MARRMTYVMVIDGYRVFVAEYDRVKMNFAKPVVGYDRDRAWRMWQ